MSDTYYMCVNWALVFKILKEMQILNLNPWLYVSFNLNAQVEIIFDVWSWMQNEYVLPK